jgi:predicted PurR-regulated permease PerM
MLFGSVIVIAVLYTAKQVFIPIALAILFAFLLKPIVSFLERRWLNRTIAVAISLSLIVILLASSGWMLLNQTRQLAHEFVQYSGNLEKKFRIFRGSEHGALKAVERTLQRIVESTESQVRPDMRVEVVPERRSLADRYEAYAPTIEYVASAFIVVVLVFFLLKDREQLRDKLLRLAGRAHLTVTTQAIGEAGHRISRYLLTQAALNIGFGILTGIGLFFLGLPHWLLWAVLAALLRFIPYIGAVLSAGLPTLLALAVYPDWYYPLMVLGLFVLMDQFIAGFVEPALIGHRVGVSPVALLVATILWAWLWGPVGLLLATPITVCLTVAGEFVPAMRIFSILLGTEASLEDYLSFYHRLLVRDRVGAAALADRFAEEHSMQKTFEELFVPALSFASEELQQKRITRAHDHFIKDTIREVTTRIGDRNAARQPDAGRVVAISIAGERVSLGTFMLAQLVREEGHPLDVFTDLEPDEVSEFINDVEPDGLLVSCSNDKNLEGGLEFLNRMRREYPDLVILAGGSAFASNARRALECGASLVAGSLAGTRDDLLRMLRKKRN